MRPIAWLLGWFLPPRGADDSAARRAEECASRFYPEAPAARIVGPLALDHARRLYDEPLATFAVLDAKAADLLRTISLATTLVFATVTGLGVPPTCPVKLSLAAFLLAIVVLILSRRPLWRPMPPRVCDVMDGIAVAPHPEAWLAASLHTAVESSRRVRSFKVRSLALATWLLVAGIFLLALAVWFYQPERAC